MYNFWIIKYLNEEKMCVIKIWSLYMGGILDRMWLWKVKKIIFVIKIWQFFNQIPQLGVFWIRSFRLSPVGLLTLYLNIGISNFPLSISLQIFPPLPNIQILIFSQFPIFLSCVLDIQLLSQLQQCCRWIMRFTTKNNSIFGTY